MSAHTKGPTLDQMHAAWLTRRREAWPPSFEEAMAHTIYSRLLSIECLRRDLRQLAMGGAKHRNIEGYLAGEPQPHVDPAAPRRRGFWMDTDADKDN